MKLKLKQEQKNRKKIKVRSKILGTKNKPRLSVFRSAKHIYAQIINDESSQTLVAASDQEFKKTQSQKNRKKIDTQKKDLTSKVAIAFEVGELIAQKAQIKKIKKVVFDRGYFKYHGQIKALADGARSGGLEF